MRDELSCAEEGFLSRPVATICALRQSYLHKSFGVLLIMTRSPRAIDTHVGSQIRARRAMLGISQAMLGDGLGISFQQVQKYEKGTNRVGAGRLQRIAELLDVPISFFFEGDVGAPQEIAAQALGVHPDLSSSESVALARAFIAIDDAVVRLRVLKLVQSLVVHRGIEA